MHFLSLAWLAVALAPAIVAAAVPLVGSKPPHGRRARKQQQLLSARRSEELIVRLPNGDGSIQGHRATDVTVDRFLGIPFAEPPVGREGRWRSPRRVKPWAPTVRNTTSYRPNCMQLNPPAWCADTAAAAAASAVWHSCTAKNSIVPRLRSFVHSGRQYARP